MKRRLLKLGVFVLLGALVNIAVAWTLAAFAPVWPWIYSPTQWNTVRSDAFKPEHFDWWAKHYPFERAATPIPPPPKLRNDSSVPGMHLTRVTQDSMAEITARGISILRATGTDQETGQAMAASAIRTRIGLPMRSVGMTKWSLLTYDPSSSKIQVEHRVVHGFELLLQVVDPRWNQLTLIMGGRYLPFNPLWPGFAINTLFYAAILALLFYGPGKVRRWIRVHRSQCPACGHIIAAGTCANGLCSECGSALPKGFKPKPEVSAHT